MTQDEKFQIQRRNTLRNLWQKLSGTPDFPVKLVLAALYFIGAVYVCFNQETWRTLAGNIPLEEQYRDIQRYQMETWRAFLRRVQNVIEYLPDGSTVQHKKGGFPCDTK